MPKLSDNMLYALIIATLCVGAIYMAKEIRGCKSDINSNIATCIESGGDAYLCCINHSSSDRGEEDCILKEKARKLRGTQE